MSEGTKTFGQRHQLTTLGRAMTSGDDAGLGNTLYASGVSGSPLLVGLDPVANATWCTVCNMKGEVSSNIAYVRQSKDT